MISTIRFRLISTSLLIVIVAIAGVGLISYKFARTFLLEDVNQRLTQLSTSEASKLGAWVAANKRIVEAMASAAVDADPAPVLQHALAAGRLDLAYIGSADKRMVSVPARERAADYDPTARPWYKLAQGVEHPVLTAPYIAASSRKLVVTFAHAIRSGGSVTAVAGADVTIEDIVSGLARIHPTPSGYLFLLDQEGRILAHPDAGLILKPATALSPDITLAGLQQASSAEELPAAVNIQDRRYLLKGAPVPGTDWMLVSAAQQGEALARLDQLLLSLAAALLVVAGCAAAVSAWSINKLLRGLHRVQAAMEQIGSGHGDLTRRLPVKGRDEIDAIAQAFNAFVEKIEQVMRKVRDSTESIATASNEIAMGAQDLSSRTEQTASNLQQTAASMAQMTDLVHNSAGLAASGEQVAGSSAELANQGGEVVTRVVSTMQDISASSARISEIIGTIDGIAFQTNILALNAAVEAARAGEQGRGFAVVAGEVRALAQRSAEAAREIKALITASGATVDRGSALVVQTGDAMKEIVDSVRRVTGIVAEISRSAAQQSQGIKEVNAAVGQVDQMTQQNAALVEQSAAAAESLKEQAGQLAAVIGTFTLSR